MVSLDFVPMPEGCAGSRGTGKPLQIAVDGVLRTTEATQHPKGGGFNRAELGLGIAFAVWLLDYASSGSLDLSMHVGISPC
jgi:hypothetical protein